MYKVNYITYQTIEDLSEAFKVSAFLIERRLATGKTIEEAVGIKSKEVDDRFICFGREYPSFRSLSVNLGVSYNGITRRLLNGMTIDEAVNDLRKVKVYTSNGEIFSSHEKLIKYKRKMARDMFPLVYKGMGFKNVGALSRHIGMGKDTLISRLCGNKTFEEAIRAVNKEVVYDDKKYSSLSALCREVGVTQTTVNYRMIRGMTLEDAVSELLLNKGEL